MRFGLERAADRWKASPGGFQIATLDDHGLEEVHCGFASPETAISSNTVFNVYCALKPVLLLGAAFECESRLGDSVFEHCLQHDDETTVRDVLAHRAGLENPGALEYLGSSSQARDRFAKSSQPTCRRQSYSEVSAVWALGRLAKGLTGRSIEVITADILRSLGLSNQLFHSRPPHSMIECIGCTYELESSIPFLHEMLPDVYTSSAWNVLGGYASASGLARWYGFLRKALDGIALPGFPRLPRAFNFSRPREFDPVLRREARFEMGLMTDLAQILGMSSSRRLVGHFGLRFGSIGLLDLDSGVAIGAIATAPSWESNITLEFWKDIIHEVLPD